MHGFPIFNKDTNKYYGETGLDFSGPASTEVKIKNIDVELKRAIDQVAKNLASAAYHCQQAGFDMVMLHGAHGQLLSQFGSQRSPC